MAMANEAQQEEALFPIGYRFSPTEEELIVFYLNNRPSPNPLSKAVHEIADFDSFAPWTLQHLYSLKRVDECYFLTHRIYGGDDPKDKSRTGRWKPGKERDISNDTGHHVGGVCRTYTYEATHQTPWMMMEYRLGNRNKRPRNEFQRVLCKIYKKHEARKPPQHSHWKDFALPPMHQDAIGPASHPNSFSHLDKFSNLEGYYHQLLRSIQEDPHPPWMNPYLPEALEEPHPPSMNPYLPDALEEPHPPLMNPYLPDALEEPHPPWMNTYLPDALEEPHPPLMNPYLPDALEEPHPPWMNTYLPDALEEPHPPWMNTYLPDVLEEPHPPLDSPPWMNPDLPGPSSSIQLQDLEHRVEELQRPPSPSMPFSDNLWAKKLRRTPSQKDRMRDSRGGREGKDVQWSKFEEESLPIGVRFQPTDQETISYILMKQQGKQPKVIHEVDVYQYDPWSLQSMYPMSRVRERYFITSRSRKYALGCRPKRTTGGGVWKSTSGDKPILDKCGNPVGGVWKSLVYLKGTEKLKTNWLMKEYRLGEAGEKKLNESDENNLKEWNPVMLDGVVVCKLYENKRTKQPSDTKEDETKVGNVEDIGGTLLQATPETHTSSPGSDGFSHQS